MPGRRPHPALRPYVEAVAGYREVLDPGAVHHGLPSPSLTAVLAFDEPLDAGWLSAPRQRASYWTCAAGLHATPALIHTHGRQHGISLSLTPLGARVLLGVPAGALAGLMASHDDLPGGVDPDVHAALAEAPTWPERFDLLERHLWSRVAVARRGAGVAPEVAEAWRLIRATHGRARVQAVADHVGWGRRRLLAAFRAELGLGPKEAARVARFDHTRALVHAGASLVEAAHAGGYADQAHLSREWSSLAGRTPTELRASPYYVG
jgi:AraC-like DNA-binding protein